MPTQTPRRFGDLLTQVIMVICFACWAVNVPRFTRTGLLLAGDVAAESTAGLPVSPADPAAEARRRLSAWIRGSLYYLKTAVSQDECFS